MLPDVSYADFARGIADADFKQEKLSFAPGVTSRCRHLRTLGRWRRMTDVDSDADRQFAWSKQGLKHARGGDLHESNHARGRKNWRERISHLDGQSACEIG